MATALFTASVTYEYPLAAPDTHRTTIRAGTAQTAAYRAMGEARRAFARKRPSSIVLLLELPDSRQEEAP